MMQHQISMKEAQLTGSCELHLQDRNELRAINPVLYRACDRTRAGCDLALPDAYLVHVICMNNTPHYQQAGADGLLAAHANITIQWVSPYSRSCFCVLLKLSIHTIYMYSQSRNPFFCTSRISIQGHDRDRLIVLVGVPSW